MEDENGGLSISRRIFSYHWEGIKRNLVTMKDEEWDVLKRKALGTIQLFPIALVAFNISKETTIKYPRKEFDKLYEKPYPPTRYFL
jgi:hypothetical protein